MDKNGKPIKESTTKSVNGALDLVTENTTSKIIIIVAVVVFLIVLACVGLRMMMNKSKMDMINEAM
jgi:flagellar basal body-associated protein FliL